MNVLLQHRVKRSRVQAEVVFGVTLLLYMYVLLLLSVEDGRHIPDMTALISPFSTTSAGLFSVCVDMLVTCIRMHRTCLIIQHASYKVELLMHWKRNLITLCVLSVLVKKEMCECVREEPPKKNQLWV